MSCRVLSRRTKNNPVLIGEPGVGKTAVVEEPGTRLSCTVTSPDPLGQEHLYTLDLSSLVAGFALPR